MEDLEPKNLDDKSNKRPDIDAYIGVQRFLIDVMITNPTAHYNLLRARKPLGSALASEKSKKNTSQLSRDTFAVRKE